MHNAPDTWHALVIPKGQTAGTGTPFAGATPRGAAEAALSHYRSAGNVE